MDLENINQLSEDNNFDVEEYGGEFTTRDLTSGDSDNENFPGDKNEQGDIKNGNEKHFIISKTNLMLVRRLIRNINDSNNKLSQILTNLLEVNSDEISDFSLKDTNVSVLDEQDDAIIDLEHRNSSELDNNIIKGIFDGIEMIGADGRQYSVPHNYASKSKLVEGDTLKLTITPRGGFIYKQIKPVERIRVVATLDQDENDDFFVYSGKRKWKVLTASVSYYRGEVGDEVVVLVPRNRDSKWAAIENIIKK